MLKTILRFGFIVIALLVLFQLSNASLFIPSIPADLVIGIGAVILIALGIYLGGNIKKDRIVQIPAPTEIDKDKIKTLGLSKREMEVLQLISERHGVY